MPQLNITAKTTDMWLKQLNAQTGFLSDGSDKVWGRSSDKLVTTEWEGCLKKVGISILPDCAFISKHLLSFQLDCFLFPPNSGWVLEQQRVGQELFMARIERDPPTTPLRWMATRTKNSIDMFTATYWNHIFESQQHCSSQVWFGFQTKGKNWKLQAFKLSVLCVQFEKMR